MFKFKSYEVSKEVKNNVEYTDEYFALEITNEIVEIIYTLDVSTKDQIIELIKNKSEHDEEEIKKVMGALIEVDGIRKHILKGEENIEIYSLGENARKYLEESNVGTVNYEMLNKNIVNDKLDKVLGKLVTNDLVIKFFKECRVFNSFEISPKIEIIYNEEKGYISPNAVINFGEDIRQVHFFVHTVRKGEDWELELKQNLKYIESMYLNFEKNEILSRKPIFLCIAEDDEQIINVYKNIKQTEIEKDYIAFIKDEQIYNKKAFESISIVIEENGEVKIKNVKISELK